MFGLSKVCKITAGSVRPKELQIVSLVNWGAVAVSAIIGTSVRARNPPIFSKQCLKSFPLDAL